MVDPFPDLGRHACDLGLEECAQAVADPAHSDESR
jgi:hypothetical protein